jgi:hypothetical protein
MILRMSAHTKVFLMGFLQVLLLLSPAHGHRDPSGETHPRVIVEDGKVGDKLWLGWVRKAAKFDELPAVKRWVTVLASLNVRTGKVEEHMLPEISHWNAHLSLNICKGWLCLAWHCSQDGSYPGHGKIMTHFQRANPQ